MVRDIDDLADERALGRQSPGEKYRNQFLNRRPKTEWSPYIDETAKDIRADIVISDIDLTKNDFGRELGEYYRRGLEQATGQYTDLPTVLNRQVSDEKLGELAYLLNELSYDISTTNLGIDDVEMAIESVIEKILTRHVGGDLSVSFNLSGATVSDITTQLFQNETIASNIDLLLSEFEESAARGLLALLDEPQMMTPLWSHQRDALQTWWENDQRGYVDMATATGKTVLGLGAIALRYGELHPEDQTIGGLPTNNSSSDTDDVLIVAQREIILEQWRREFEHHLNIPKERTTGSDDIKLEWGTMHFRTAQSLVNEERVSYDLVLLDEAHHYATGSEWGSLLDDLDGSVLAMSGSVDDAGSDSNRIKERLTNSIGPIAKRYSITEARADGVIPSFDWEVHYAGYDAVGSDLEKTAKRAERSFKKFQQRLHHNEVDLETDRRLKTYEDIRRFSHTNEGSSLKQKDDDFRDLVTILFSRRTKRWNLSPALESVINLVIEHCTTEKVVVLADSNAQVEELESRLSNVVSNPGAIYLVSGAKSQEEQRETIEEFDQPETAGILIGTGDLLGEGVDMQHASVAINMATGGVNQELVQRIGRVLRNPVDTPKHAMFYNVVGVPPTESAAVLREDGKRLIEQAAGFCSLGRRFNKLPGFSASSDVDKESLENVLTEGASFIQSLDDADTYDWDEGIINYEDLLALQDIVEDTEEDIDTILGEWEEYSWEHSEELEVVEDETEIERSESELQAGARENGTDTEESLTTQSPTTDGDRGIDVENVPSTSDTTQARLGNESESKDERPTADELIDEIVRVESVVDDVPTKSQMADQGTYAIAKFEEELGSWSEAVEQAGFEPHGAQKKQFTRSDVVDGLKTVAKDLGKSPSVGDINQHAPFSAAIVYNFFESIGEARQAAGVENVSESPPPDSEEKSVSSIEPNELAEYYELFRTFGSLLNRLLHSERTTYSTDGDHPLNEWQSAVSNVVFGSGLSADAPNYGQQQGSRNPHKMSEYRRAFGDGETVTEYQLIPTVQPSDEDVAVLTEKEVIEPDEQFAIPVAPHSDVAFPIAVSTQKELENALALLEEFPAEPQPAGGSVTTSASTSPIPHDGEDNELADDPNKDAEPTSHSEPSGEGDAAEASTQATREQLIFWNQDVEDITEFTEDEPDTESEPVAGDSLDQKIDEWKSQLLDLTRRNNLISFTPTKTKSLPLEQTNPTTIAAYLDLDAELYIRKQPADDSEAELEDLDEDEVLATRVPDEADRSLHQIGITNKQYLREQGVDALYLSLGMVSWYSVDYSDEPNRSPLFLAPVELEEKTLQASDKHDYVITPKAEEFRLNPALRKKLAAERNISLPSDSALSLETIDAAFESVYQTLSGFDQWVIQPDVVLGIFDFTKFSLYSDLERNRSAIKSDPIINALNGEMEPVQEAEGDITTPSASEVDDVVDPVDTYQVLEADSSQQEAIEAAKRGKSFVLQGPPGTGKSQTIANIITEKLAAGERVLFVSEKQAALDVVKSRLDDVGLGRFCLEVHGEKATNKGVLNSLETELKAPQIKPADTRRKRLKKLQKRRNEINSYGRQLFFSPTGWDLTAYQAFGIVSHYADAPRVEIGIDDPLGLDQETVEQSVDELETLARYDDHIDSYETGLWRHTTLRQWGVDTNESMRTSLDQQIAAIEPLQEIAGDIELALSITADSIADIRQVTQLLAYISDRPEIDWQPSFFEDSFIQEGSRFEKLAELESERASLMEELSDRYNRSFFSADGSDLNTELAGYGLLKILKPSYRSLKRQVTNHCQEGYDPDHDQLLEDTRKLAEIQRIEERRDDFRGVIQRLGPLYDGGDTDWETLSQAQEWVSGLANFDDTQTEPVISALIEGRLPAVDPILTEVDQALEAYDDAAAFFEGVMDVDEMTIEGVQFRRAQFSSLLTRLEHLRDDVPAFQRRVQFEAQLETVQETLCGDYVDKFLAGAYESEALVPAFKKRFYTKWLNGVYEKTELSSFNVDEMERYIDEFRQLDREQQELAKVQVQHEVTTQRPTLDLEHASSSEQVLVRREAEKQRRHKPLRELFDEAGSFITQLTPCFMMSPLSVAQYLKASSIHFDTVVFDEASQIMPQDAVSSLIRADQAIIAGDTKQLPPTSFFSADVETTEDVREDLDSILEETASVLPEKSLQWHYRSRTEELIQFSNYHYYDNNLRTFPENDPDVETGVSFEYVEDGVYDRGGSRQNVVEAERVIDLIQDHAEERSDKSLGVVAFSSAQEQAIRDALEERRQDHPVLNAFVDQDDVLDEFFIKNLEMVQGDERDRMIFSIGYGPAQDGTISTNFGPINKTGGERRLNVAVTRAKEHITVVSSMLPGEIDLSGSQSTGAQHFKNYLKYARQGEQALVRNDQVSNALEFDSQFEEAVYDALEQEGYDVVSQVESSGYSIDLAIKHPEQPGKFILGIECDGAAYHSSKTARDRDRNRQMVLEDLGWNIHRIWSPDWTSNRERQIQQINEQVELLLDGNVESLHSKEVKTHEPEAVASTSELNHDALTEYEEPSLKWTDRYSVNKRGRATANRNAVKDTVVQNGPIEYETAIQTELDVWSQSRAGKRVRRVFDKNVDKLEGDGELYQHDGFLWQSRDELDFKVRVNTEQAKRSIDKVPKEELAKAIAVILEEGGQMTRDDLELETTRLVGYQRRGKRIKQRIDAALNILENIGVLVETTNGKVNIDTDGSIDDALLDRIY